MLFYKYQFNLQIDEKTDLQAINKMYTAFRHQVLESREPGAEFICLTPMDVFEAGGSKTIKIMQVCKPKGDKEKLPITIFKSYFENLIPYTFKVQEITLKEFCQTVGPRYSREMYHAIKTDVLHTDEYEEILVPCQKLSKAVAMRKAQNIMAGKDFLEELDRIYSSKNSKVFLGHPVHYVIKASSLQAGEEMCQLLIQALYSNHRLSSTRATKLLENSSFWDNDTDTLLSLQEGASTIMATWNGDSGSLNFAGSGESMVEGAASAFERLHQQVLFIFLEDRENPGFSQALQNLLLPISRLITLEEGSGTPKQITAYCKELAKAKNTLPLWKRTPFTLPEEETTYSLTQALNFYREWEKEAISNCYGAYKLPIKAEAKQQTEVSDKSYQKLQELVGLKPIKALIEEIIAVHKMNLTRSSMGLSTVKASKHMIFTGNPGSAKTTVARLLTKVFHEEGIISHNLFVECGRSDLVGKYVGWTAQQVKKKFREAVGGVLFIDEAYSLVDDSNSFGDEAINTIVQEMENLRNRVVVIFAGYPDKMKQFLEKNEGLQSRITFHLDFPDYSAEEMLDILKLHATQRGFKISEEGCDAALQLFRQAVTYKDNGNGRLVRNLLEKALLKQSLRLAQLLKTRQLTAQEMVLLTADDFQLEDTLKGLTTNKAQHKLGFKM